MTPKLTWIDDQGREQSIEVSDRLFVGRTCHGVEPDKRIIIDDERVSRDHAAISFAHGLLTLRDTSRNGTHLNGVRLTSGVDYPLKPGDQITIGSRVFTLHWGDDAHAVGRGDEDDTTRTVALAQTVTHLVADVRGFSTWVQATEPERVYRLMSETFEVLSAEVHAHHGVVKDYIGDAIYAFWEHGPQSQPQQAVHAVRAALAQRAAIEKHLAAQASGFADEAKLRMGWAITTGAVMLGHYGVKPDTLAVVGDSANLAFRLAGLANNKIAAPIVLCSYTERLVRTEMETQPLGEVETKGRSGLEKVFGIKP